ncbi:hypothetical protein HYALB_00004002 [Hymenoscyphus albidus]|uniref:Cytochrome P450 n=1 Tax=Hymenoscyphus albidus TaxID=595503 RepID=A0A9N9QD60_9HELO|nr:hypothetical protein HYALB_00004002 [Hymenoscyphus albidus]
MTSMIAITTIGIALWLVYTNATGLRKHIAQAKRSGLPYAVAPITPYNVFWMVTSEFWIPLFKLLPTAWTEGWLTLHHMNWVWTMLYEPVKKEGEIKLIVAPGGTYIWITNAEAIHQITTRREAFPKPLESYKIMEIFGRNIISLEGPDWKRHRKITSPGFNEKNNVLVFSESCAQAQGMLRKWLGPDGRGNKTITEVPADTMRLTLHIISRIGFGVQLLWDGEPPKEKTSAQDAVYSSNTPSGNHTMSFSDSLSVLLERMLMVLLMPKWILKRLPFHAAREAYESYVNWVQYMDELFAQKVAQARAGEKRSEGMDIMGSLVKSSYGQDNDSSPNNKSGKIKLSDSDILGNAFVMIVAGHETTANSIHFSLIELAINPRPQRLVQEEIDGIFGDSDPSTWDYESSINLLLGGMTGAVLNEELRRMPPVISIPKSVTDNSDQDIVVEGKKYTLPAGARLMLNTIGVQRSPRYWPTQPSKETGREDDLDDFKPERWFIDSDSRSSSLSSDSSKPQVDTPSSSDADAEADEFGGYTGSSSHSKLFHPVRGSYLPFSDGPRSCVGRRLAQVKIMAILATIFQKYSIELAADEWATDEEVAEMTEEERRVVYGKAQKKAKETLRGASPLITLKIQGPGYVPVRLVRRGEERFGGLFE